MQTRPVRAYLDSNVLIAYAANEEGRAGTVQSVLDDARDEKIELYTSVLSITEVAFVATDEADDPVDNEEAIDQLYFSSLHRPTITRMRFTSSFSSAGVTSI